MRSYQLTPGTLLEWEAAWRRGIEARKKFVVRFRACDLALSREKAYRY
jgi:hypothetical protein